MLLITLKKNIYKTALFIASKKGFIEIVEKLISHKEIDINYQNVSKNKFFITFQIKILISFQNYVFNDISD